MHLYINGSHYVFQNQFIGWYFAATAICSFISYDPPGVLFLQSIYGTITKICLLQIYIKLYIYVFIYISILYDLDFYLISNAI